MSTPETKPTNAPAVQQPKQLTPIDKLKAFLTGDAMKAQIMMALPKHIDIEKFIRILMTAVSQNPKLATFRRSCFRWE